MRHIVLAAFGLSISVLIVSSTAMSGMVSKSAGSAIAKRIGKIKPETSVFLLCDIQERFRPLIWRGETVINTSRYMTSVAKALEIPIVITQQYTKVFGKTCADCFADPDDLEKLSIFEKKNFSMCTDEVTEHLQQYKFDSVVLFGIECKAEFFSVSILLYMKCLMILITV